MSSVYCPLPTRKRLSSLRRTEAPMPSGMLIVAPPSRSGSRGRVARLRLAPGAPSCSPPLEGSCAPPRGHHRLDDVVVAGAPAKVALEPVADFLLRRPRTALEEIDGGHDHPRRAETALQPVVLLERGLHRVEQAVLRQPLDGGDVRPLGLAHQHLAALHPLPVDHHHAGAALAGVAADVGPGEPEVLAQELHEERAWLDVDGPGLTVDLQGDRGHETSVGEGSRAPMRSLIGYGEYADRPA